MTTLLPPGLTVAVAEAPSHIPATVLGQLASPDLTTVAYCPSPERRNTEGVAAEVLQALGKSTNVTGKPRHSSNARNLVPVWLTAHHTTTLLALSCQRTPPSDLLALIDMCHATPTNLIFACDQGFANRVLTSLSAAAPQHIDWPTVPTTTTTTADADTAATSGWDPYAREVLPNTEYWTFYATARRQMPPDQFAPVHDLYLDTMRRTNTWLDQHTHSGTHVTVTGAHHVIKTLLEEQPTFDQVTVVTRAAQAAFHNAGWLLTVDERELRNGLVRHQFSSTLPHLFNRLRAYYEPARAATVALYLADATPTAIRATTINDLAQWRHDPSQPVASVSVPPAAAPYLRAALLARAADGADPTSPAFLGSHRRVGLDIRQAARDLDLNIGDANLNETSTLNSRRIPARIVKLEALT